MAKRILIIDDEPDFVETLKLRLESEGYEIITAYNGEEGLKKAKTENPDLILLDLMLPVIDGYNVCRLLKYDTKYRSIPIIMVTAKGDESDKHQGMSIRADDYVIKPFDPAVLLEKIAKHLVKK